MIYRYEYTIIQIMIFVSEHENFDQKQPNLGNPAAEKHPGISAFPNRHIPAINALANGHGQR